MQIQDTGNQNAHRKIEYRWKIKEEVRAMQSEIKKNIQGTNSVGKESGIQINDLKQKEEINIQSQ